MPVDMNHSLLNTSEHLRQTASSAKRVYVQQRGHFCRMAGRTRRMSLEPSNGKEGKLVFERQQSRYFDLR